MQTRGRPEAAAAIWEWQARADAYDGAAAADLGKRRLRGTVQAAVGIVIGALLFTFFSRVAGAVVMTVGSVILLAALLSPGGLFATIERGFVTLGQWVGRALSYVLLSLIFWAFFVPFGLLFRRGRRDSMKRYYEPDAETYWTGREPGRTASRSRERQY